MDGYIDLVDDDDNPMSISSISSISIELSDEEEGTDRKCVLCPSVWQFKPVA